MSKTVQMDTIIEESNRHTGGEPNINPTLTLGLARELVRRGWSVVTEARNSLKDPPISVSSVKCTLRCALECHEVELAFYKDRPDDHPIRSALARSIWFECADFTLGPRCKWPIVNSRGLTDSYRFVMYDPEE